MPCRSQLQAKVKRSRRGMLRAGIMAGVIVLILVFYAVGGHHWLSVQSLREHRDSLLQFVSVHYWLSLLLLAGATVVLVGVSMPAAAPLMLLSGMVFGCWIGSALMVVCCSLGATLTLLGVRYLAGDFVRARLKGHRHVQDLVKGFKQNRNSYLLFLRVAPAFPFWITNLLVGLTDISALRFLLLTMLGIVPDAIIYCNIGANLARVKSAHDLLSGGSITALILLALLCLLPVVLKRLQMRGVLPQGWPFHSP